MAAAWACVISPKMEGNLCCVLYFRMCTFLKIDLGIPGPSSNAWNLSLLVCLIWVYSHLWWSCVPPFLL